MDCIITEKTPSIAVEEHSVVGFPYQAINDKIDYEQDESGKNNNNEITQEVSS
jgi:hypothetical protein